MKFCKHGLTVTKSELTDLGSSLHARKRDINRVRISRMIIFVYVCANRMIPIADAEYDEHLEELNDE